MPIAIESDLAIVFRNEKSLVPPAPSIVVIKRTFAQRTGQLAYSSKWPLVTRMLVLGHAVEAFDGDPDAAGAAAPAPRCDGVGGCLRLVMNKRLVGRPAAAQSFIGTGVNQAVMNYEIARLRQASEQRRIGCEPAGEKEGAFGPKERGG